MSTVLRQFTKRNEGKALADGWTPKAIRYNSGEKTVIEFENNREAFASCLRCHDAPCATFAMEETVPSNFEAFPSDRNTDTCAAGAINWTAGSGSPTINSDLCMFCGVCASRCPVGAIRLVSGQGAVVEDSANEAFVETTNFTPEKIVSDRSKFAAAKTSGILLLEDDLIVDEAFKRLNAVWAHLGDRFPNILSRNLLIGAGLGAAIGRKGNVHMRMDIILSPPGVTHGMGEVEFGQEAVLDAPRDILDALAVMASRYGWQLPNTTALIITNVLPNKRSEYWSILKDINQVLGLRIGTITIFALMLLNWSRRYISFEKQNLFYADRDTQSYRKDILEPLLNRPLHVGLDARSEIDIAK